MDRSSVADRLHSAAIRVLRHARESDRTSGLGPARLSALSVLVYGGGCTIGALAAAEHVTAPTMTRIVQGLASQKLVERERSSRDARAALVRATPKGKALLKRARLRRLERVEQLLSAAHPKDVDALGAALVKIFPDRG